MSNIVIRCSVDELMHDIKHTTDPIKKMMLKKFLDIKMSEMRAEAEDPSLDGLSDVPEDNRSAEDDEDQKSKNTKNRKSVTKSKAEKEIENIMKDQQESISELDRLAKIKAYSEMLAENKKETDQRTIEQKRGKTEKMWQSRDIYDPRYVKYAKEDSVNNKMMERLNSEIDFRTDDGKRTKIEKPFGDDDDVDGTDEYAKYEMSKNEKIKYVPKNRQRIGERKAIRY
jgi:hypothetical protein